MKGRAIGAWILAASLAACSGAPEVELDEPRSGSAELAAPETGSSAAVPVNETSYLERRVELAKGDSFYLLLDQEAHHLRLMYGGALLQSYTFRSLGLGRPRALFSSVGDPVEWQGTIWEAGLLSPPRPEVSLTPIAPADEEAEDLLAIVPPTAQEAISVPSRYRIRFEGGLALEVRTPAEGLSWWARQRASWALRWDDVRSAVFPSDRDSVRVLITLDPEAAAALYRALPPETKLLVSYRH